MPMIYDMKFAEMSIQFYLLVTDYTCKGTYAVWEIEAKNMHFACS